jgi:hypothetical protein
VLRPIEIADLEKDEFDDFIHNQKALLRQDMRKRRSEKNSKSKDDYPLRR